MKKCSRSSKIRMFILVVLSFIIIGSCLSYRKYSIYNSISVTTEKRIVLEYGSKESNIKNLITKIDGKIINVKKDIDTNIMGKQEIILEVEKNNIVKEVPIIIEVVDTVAPVIEINEEKISLTEGDGYDLVKNIKGIIDNVDKDLNFMAFNEVTSESRGYYTVVSDSDISSVGTHNISIRAVDKSGNSAETSYIIETSPRPVISYAFRQQSYNVDANIERMIGIAYSLIGSRYVAGGTTPNGFDCSGFIMYLYSQIGIPVSRSASTQMYDGYAVSYYDAQPGDILSWGYVGGTATHSALYVGNGQMIHATNPVQGVIASDVAAWARGSGTQVIAVRRIK